MKVTSEFPVRLFLGSMAVLFSGCPNQAETPPPPIQNSLLAPPPVTTAVPDAGPPTPPPSANCDPVQIQALTTMFQAREKNEALNMQVTAGPTCGVVAEGQTVASSTFLLEPGYCYTFLGQALPTVTDLDLQVELDLAGGGMPPALAAFNIKPVLAVDAGDAAPQSVIGAKQNCYHWPFPIPATVRMVAKAHTGAGPIAAQAYKRKK